jgi:hypothetical protein
MSSSESNACASSPEKGFVSYKPITTKTSSTESHTENHKNESKKNNKQSINRNSKTIIESSDTDTGSDTDFDYDNKVNKANKVNCPIIIIPAGTTVCPETRAQMGHNYYITLNDEIRTQLDSQITVMINGSNFNVNVHPTVEQSTLSSNVHICSGNRTPFQSFVVPTGTSYFINDAVRDSLGLSHLTEINSRFRIAPGSTVYLQAGTELTLYNNIIPPHPIDVIPNVAQPGSVSPNVSTISPSQNPVHNNTTRNCNSCNANDKKLNIMMILKNLTKCNV